MTTLLLPTPPPSRAPRVNTMFERILLAIDFGRPSLAAARFACAEIATRADAILAHVVPAATDDAECAVDDEFQELRRLVPALSGGLGGFAATLGAPVARSILRVGRPSRWLSVLAQETDATLVVLGRRSDSQRVRVGEPNVIERTTRRTNASVLVVPEGATQPPSHVIAAVDDGAAATHVLRVAGWLSRLREIPLTVLHVLSPIAGTYERVIRRARQLAPKSGETLRRGADDATVVGVGDPAREIVRAAMGHSAPIIVVGVRGADGAPSGSVGSVTRELLARAPFPVLAVNDT